VGSLLSIDNIVVILACIFAFVTLRQGFKKTSYTLFFLSFSLFLIRLDACGLKECGGWMEGIFLALYMFLFVIPLLLLIFIIWLGVMIHRAIQRRKES